jgi:hypothetical protein
LLAVCAPAVADNLDCRPRKVSGVAVIIAGEGGFCAVRPLWRASCVGRVNGCGRRLAEALRGSPDVPHPCDHGAESKVCRSDRCRK